MRTPIIAAHWRPEVQQAIFKEMLQAISYPGEIRSLEGLIEPGQAHVALLATLVDGATTYADVHNLLLSSDLPFIESTEEVAGAADYILVDETQEPPASVKNGTIYRPDESATVIVRTQALGEGTTSWVLTGPGIEKIAYVCGSESLQRWFDWRSEFVAYPQGIDLLICDSIRFIAIPRTTRVDSATGENA